MSLLKRVLQVVSRSSQYAVANQVRPEHVKEIASQGYASIISVRPDGEQPGQPTAIEVFNEAKKYGLFTAHYPVDSSEIVFDDYKNFSEAIKYAPTPALVYCRTGQRAQRLLHGSEFTGLLKPPVKKVYLDHDQWY